MHVLFRQTQGNEEQDAPVDLGQAPAPLVVLSYSDSDLSAFAAGWRRAPDLPALRLANLSALRHPLSVDTYLQNTLSAARGVLVRLIGGEQYWAYGLAELAALARRNGIALAVLPADGRPDARLEALSTLPGDVLARLCALCDAGGAGAGEAALRLLARAAGFAVVAGAPAEPLPAVGWYDPDRGVIDAPARHPGAICVTFYRAYLTSADTGPVDALLRAFRAAGRPAFGLFAPSLKGESAGAVAAALAALAPAAIVNATAFSAADGAGLSPLDAPGCPVFQVALSAARRESWGATARGLSPADLAMHVVLPEVDGRLFLGAVSFKEPGTRDDALQWPLAAHAAEAPLVNRAVARVLRHVALAEKANAAKGLALILSTYPGKAHQLAHAVGLDPLASLDVLLPALAAEGYAVETRAPAEGYGAALHQARIAWPLEAYRAARARLPAALVEELDAAWGAPEDDPDAADGAMRFRALRQGAALIALQPERALFTERDGAYHDTTRVPRHAYVAFYLWLQAQAGPAGGANAHPVDAPASVDAPVDAIVHLGAHGTLEWLPGKAVALSEGCWPAVLAGDLPILYPFIVNDPGEAAQAKRRIGAVTIGHLPPPLALSGTPEGLVRLETLLDEFSTAEGLDLARRDRLIGLIRDEARARGVEAELDLDADASPAEALVRIDRFVCDLKESRYGAGLHVFGAGACGAAERAGLLAALAGRRVPAGPSGSPHRGRKDVLPTGRNLYAVDPRAVPTRAAHAQGVRLAEELVRRHLQDEGDYPAAIVVDLWGSATMRTAGEDFAMALHLAGLEPVWDAGSERVSGFAIIPLAVLGRRRIDVTLRVSGLFRDAFAGLAQMFDSGAEALATRSEEGEDNPYSARGPRVFGPAPGAYGLGMGALPDVFTDAARQAAGEAWLAASSHAINRRGESAPARGALESRIRAADAFVHAQDLPETDLLLAADYAAHEGGFAAARAALGTAVPALYHLDTTDPDRPRARALTEEIARVVRARATHPGWIAGMMAHGFRGAAEIAATFDHLAAFAQLTRQVPDHLFDLLAEATLADPAVVAFMARENPGALAALRGGYARLAAAGLWRTRRNSLSALIDAAPADVPLEGAA